MSPLRMRGSGSDYASSINSILHGHSNTQAAETRVTAPEASSRAGAALLAGKDEPGGVVSNPSSTP